MSFLARIRSWLRRDQLDRDMAEKMRAHIEERTQRNIAARMSEDDARAAARRQCGGMAQIQERTREAQNRIWMDTIVRDVRNAVRSLRRAPGFSLAAVVTLTLGIGAATAVFLLTDQILFRGWSFPASDRLFVIGYTSRDQPSVPWCFGFRFEAYRDQTDVFEAFAVGEPEVCNVILDGEPVASNLARISAETFPTLGLRCSLGRSFLPDEFRDGNDDVVIISDSFWRRHFDRDPAVLERELRIDEQLCRIVGVLPPDEDQPRYIDNDVLRPLHLTVDPARPFSPRLFVMGRLREGVSRVAAEAAMAGVQTSVNPIFTNYFSGQEPRLYAPNEYYRLDIYWLLCGGGALLYVIACLNTTNLMLVRVAGRRREMSVRLAVGASRWQVTRLVLAESAGLLIMTAVAALLLAQWVLPPLLAAVAGSTQGFETSLLGWRTTMFVGLLCAVTWAIIAVVPALSVFRAGVHGGLKQGGGAIGDSPTVRRVRQGLVVMQAALAVLLLVGAGLMVRTVQQLRNIDLGFDPEPLLRVDLAFPDGYVQEPAARLRMFRRLQEELAVIPGVERVAFAGNSLLPGTFYGVFDVLQADGTTVSVMPDTVSENYVATAGLRLWRGRRLSTEPNTREVMLNRALAAHQFGDEDPIGQPIRLKLGENVIPWTVVGVVNNLRENHRSAPGLHLFLPDHFMPLGLTSFLLQLEPQRVPDLERSIRRVLYENEPRLIATTVAPMQQIADWFVRHERLADVMLRGLSMIALALSVVGLFSVLAYNVDQRRREFGVRAALGATPGNLAKLIIRHGLLVAVAGIAVGIAGALVLTRFMTAILFETTPNEPIVYLGVAALLLVVALAASWWPAVRVTRINPVETLRAE